MLQEHCRDEQNTRCTNACYSWASYQIRKIADPLWRRKSFLRSGRMCNRQFYVSDKRPMGTCMGCLSFLLIIAILKWNSGLINATVISASCNVKLNNCQHPDEQMKRETNHALNWCFTQHVYTFAVCLLMHSDNSFLMVMWWISLTNVANTLQQLLLFTGNIWLNIPGCVKRVVPLLLYKCIYHFKSHMCVCAKGQALYKTMYLCYHAALLHE